VEALTLRAVAERASVSHGSVLFHFRRRDELVAHLLERVLYATATLRVPDGVERLTRPSEKLLALLRAEMDRLSSEPRHFRLFLEFWTLGIRRATIRRRVGQAIESYRSGIRALTKDVVDAQDQVRSKKKDGSPIGEIATPEGVAAVSVSLIHGCALQAVIDPDRFDVSQHFDAASQMLAQLARPVS
jgi:AcrR family transcriptional regulator